MLDPNPLSVPRVLILGASGTIGRAVTQEALRCQYAVTAVYRKAPVDPDPKLTVIEGQVNDGQWLSDICANAHFDVVISCLASRGGGPKDAWAIDHDATVGAIKAALTSNVGHFILLSAICVQKPKLAFQHAKLAAEKALVDSGLTYSIVRPTAFFKSLSGQIGRVQKGKAFLMFGDGTLTKCTPISDRDLATYVVGCIGVRERQNAILPIGGPGPAVGPKEQGQHLFDALGKPPKFKSVPVAMFDVIAWVLDRLAWLKPSLADKAEFARIGKYYATESMLVWDPERGTYDAEATPSFGSDRLFDYYDSVLAETDTVEKGAHSVF